MTERIYYWQRIQRGSVRLTAKMWHSPDGDVIPLRCDIKGLPRTIGTKSPTRLVRFDKHYAIQFIIDRVIKPLAIGSREQLDELLASTWAIYSDQQAKTQKTDEEE